MDQFLPLYAAKIAGGALRHDFREPLNRIGRNANAVLELLEEGVLSLRNRSDEAILRRFCSQACDREDAIQSSLRTFSQSIREAISIDVPTLRWRVPVDAAYSKLHGEVYPLISSLSDTCLIVWRILRTNRSPQGVHERGASMLSAARRVHAMYDGLRYFFRIDDVNEAAFDRLEVATIVRAVIPTETTVGGTRLPKFQVLGEAQAEIIEPQFALIFQNLFSNSVKFTGRHHDPRVTITIANRRFVDLQAKYPESLQKYSAVGEWVEITVSDNGVGLSEEIRESIFKLYYTNKADGLNPFGTGLGLSIAKCSTLIHGGTLFVSRSSSPTAFTVVIPKNHREGISRETLMRWELVQGQHGNTLPQPALRNSASDHS